MGETEQPVSEMANSFLNGKSHVRLLEAGCGSASHVRLNAEVDAVGIDISQEQLEVNTAVREKILGDIQDFPLPQKEFDVVVCWMVLEHLPRPNDALLNMFGAVKPSGLVILGFPNLLSFKGLVTKITPFWFHNLFYKFMKYQSRHFPTYLRVAILPDRISRFAEAHGFSVAFCKVVEGRVPKRFRSRFWLVDVAFRAMNLAAQILSLGRWQSFLHDECAMILRRGEECS